MFRRIIFWLFIVSIALGSVWLFVLRAPQSEVGNGGVHVVASIYPLAYIASAVGGDLVSVRTLVPSGTEAHDYEPSPRDFVEIGRSDIFFYNGAGFEPWVNKWQEVKSAGDLRTINVADMLGEYGVPLLNRNNVIDPHFWLDSVIFQKEIEIVRDAIIRADPEHADIFIENATVLTNIIRDTDEQLQKGLASCALREVIVSHDAFGYLARRYGISVTSIAGISPDEEPAPKDLARISAIAREKGIKYIFSETVASPKFSEAIAREIGGQVLVLNPIESLTPSDVQLGEDYVSKMKMNLTNLQTAMTCQ